MRTIIILLTILSFFLVPAFSQVDPVHIPDPNLDRLIRQELDVPRGTPLLREDMLRLTGLLNFDENIADLTGLEHATNLGLVILHYSPIRDLSPLGNLPNLEVLHMQGVLTKNINALANAAALRDLFMPLCEIEDISAIARLTNLVSLDLAGNRISDISALANLTALETLHIERNQIVDVSPLAGLTGLKELHIFHNPATDLTPLWNLTTTDVVHDEECLVPSLSVHDRMSNRSFPSIGTLWGSEVITKQPMSYLERQSLHDLHANPVFLDIRFVDNMPNGFQKMGYMEGFMEHVEYRRFMNPNTLFFDHVRQRDAFPYDAVGAIYPEDWEYWLRDANGNRVPNRGHENCYLIDFRMPGAQDIIVEKAIAVSKCGLYDGIFFDWWTDRGITLFDFGPPFIGYSTEAEELEARLNILRRIRENVRDDFLIIGNNLRRKYPLFAPYMNGNFMELRFNGDTMGYTRDDIIEIETNLIWLEQNMREPQTNCLQAIGIPDEPGDSPRNMQYMRLFTTMSLTCSDGYVVYTLGGAYTPEWADLDHMWYDFWDTDLGQPVERIATSYRDVEGVYIREFTNGWAVYNRSGAAHAIELPEKVQSVRSGLEGDSHAVPDLDGDIFLRVEILNPLDRNGDGLVNILDLVIVASSLGTGENDVNGDGVTNVFDLVTIANAINP